MKTAGTTWLEELIGLAEAGGEGLRGIDEVEEMMRNARPFLDRRFCGSDIHVPKDLHRIRVHDFAVESFREFDRDRGFSRARRAGDDDDGRTGFRLRGGVRILGFLGVVVHGAAHASAVFV